MWPKEIRSDLRAGMKAKHYEDFDLSERYLRRYDLVQRSTIYDAKSTSLGLGRALRPYR